jgi:hypothetical protein
MISIWIVCGWEAHLFRSISRIQRSTDKGLHLWIRNAEDGMIGSCLTWIAWVSAQFQIRPLCTTTTLFTSSFEGCKVPATHPSMPSLSRRW